MPSTDSIPFLPTLAECHLPIERYAQMLVSARGGPFAPRVVLSALDCLLLRELAASSLVAPCIVDLASGPTGGASVILWLASNRADSVIVPQTDAPWRALVQSAIPILGLDPARLAFWDGDARTGKALAALAAGANPFAPLWFCMAADEETQIGRQITGIFATGAEAVMVCCASGSALDALLATGRRRSARSATALRDKSPFFAASRLVIIHPKDSRMAAAIERIALQFDGNFNFATLSQGMSALAEQISKLERQASAPLALPQAHTAAANLNYRELRLRIREVISETVPAQSTVAIASKGDDELLTLENARGWHFPQTDGGVYAGHHPADSAEALNHLERLRDKGAEYFVLPKPMRWWLGHYADFAEHLAQQYGKVFDDPQTCTIYNLAGQNGSRVARHAEVSVPVAARIVAGPHPVRLIAFYLPQFHPIPENNEWWGEGFTEWRNVSKAQPLFPRHYQPHIAADLGYYDLRLPETRLAQAELAAEHGIHGFCYYHYWFHGKRLLEKPFSEVLSTGEPDFPFCLCWANESWSRRWDGSEKNILQQQSYSAEDDLNHIRALLPALADPRAIRIDGKPVFLIYRVKDLPDPARTVETWRREVERAGLDGIHLIAVETSWDLGLDVTDLGFDARVLFQPQWSKLGLAERIAVPDKPELRVYDYEQAWRILSNPDPVSYRRYETVFPSWDNTARTADRAFVFHNATPESYERWLRQAIERAQAQPPGHRVVFINAWNEWAEGAHLEPDLQLGRGYLDATRRAMEAGTRAEHPESIFTR